MSHRRGSSAAGPGSGFGLFTRQVEMETSLKSLRIVQATEGDVWCVVWDASLVLLKYLEVQCARQADLLAGTRLLELGAGLGLVGLAAATLGAQVTLTDLPEAQNLLRLNIAENRAAVASVGGYVVAETLMWGDLSSDLLKMEFDYVVLADCVYYEEAIDPLVQTLSNINKTSMKKPTVYLTQELRDSERQRSLWKSFSEKILENFVVEEIPEEQQHPEYRSQDIVLLKLTRK